jgi:DNA invertase Pin-like site-specific DNA recombinase
MQQHETCSGRYAPQQSDQNPHYYILILNMMVSVAQFEREMMKERQVEGIKRAQAEGKYKGRVPKAMQHADKVKALVAAGVDRVKIQEQLGMSKASYYRCLKS